MNLNLTGVHLEITPAIRAYVLAKLDRVNRHFDHVIDVNVVLSVDKLRTESRSERPRARQGHPCGGDRRPTCTLQSTPSPTSSTGRC